MKKSILFFVLSFLVSFAFFEFEYDHYHPQGLKRLILISDTKNETVSDSQERLKRVLDTLNVESAKYIYFQKNERHIDKIINLTSDLKVNQEYRFNPNFSISTQNHFFDYEKGNGLYFLNKFDKQIKSRLNQSGFTSTDFSTQRKDVYKGINRKYQFCEILILIISILLIFELVRPSKNKNYSKSRFFFINVLLLFLVTIGLGFFNHLHGYPEFMSLFIVCLSLIWFGNVLFHYISIVLDRIKIGNSTLLIIGLISLQIPLTFELTKNIIQVTQIFEHINNENRVLGKLTDYKLLDISSGFFDKDQKGSKKIEADFKLKSGNLSEASLFERPNPGPNGIRSTNYDPYEGNSLLVNPTYLNNSLTNQNGQLRPTSELISSKPKTLYLPNSERKKEQKLVTKYQDWYEFLTNKKIKLAVQYYKSPAVFPNLSGKFTSETKHIKNPAILVVDANELSNEMFFALVSQKAIIFRESTSFFVKGQLRRYLSGISTIEFADRSQRDEQILLLISRSLLVVLLLSFMTLCLLLFLRRTKNFYWVFILEMLTLALWLFFTNQSFLQAIQVSALPFLSYFIYVWQDYTQSISKNIHS